MAFENPSQIPSSWVMEFDADDYWLLDPYPQQSSNSFEQQQSSDGGIGFAHQPNALTLPTIHRHWPMSTDQPISWPANGLLGPHDSCLESGYFTTGLGDLDLDSLGPHFPSMLRPFDHVEPPGGNWFVGTASLKLTGGPIKADLRDATCVGAEIQSNQKVAESLLAGDAASTLALHDTSSTAFKGSFTTTEIDIPRQPSQSELLNCHECNVGFLDQKSLRRHLRSRHANPHGKIHTCNTCRRAFKYNRDLKRHQRTHDIILTSGVQVRTGEIFYCKYEDCAYARKGFLRRDNCLRHMRKQHGEVTHNGSSATSVASSSTDEQDSTKSDSQSLVDEAECAKDSGGVPDIDFSLFDWQLVQAQETNQ